MKDQWYMKLTKRNMRLNILYKTMLLLSLVVIITGCSPSNKMELKNRTQIIEELIKAINENKSESIYCLYANEVKNSQLTLQAQIKELCDFFDEEIVSFDFIGGRESDGYYENDHYRKKIVASYMLTTESGKEYIISYKAHTIGTDSESTGLYSLAAISRDDYEADSLKEYFLLLDGVVIVDEQREKVLKERICH